MNDSHLEASQYLSARGVLEETVKLHGVAIDPAPTAERMEERLNQRFDNGDLPGAVLWFDAGWVKDTDGYVPTFYLARCFPPLFRYGKETKFLSPKERPQQPYILPPSLNLAHQLNVPVVVTEGPTRSLLLFQSGICTIALPGIWNATQPRTDEEKAGGTKLVLHLQLQKWVWTGREVLLGFDQDYLINQDVLHALIRNIVLFSAAGAFVKLVRWDGAVGKGLDDYVSNKAGLVVSDQTAVLSELLNNAVNVVDFLSPHYVDLVLHELAEVEMSSGRRHQLAKAWAKKLGTSVESLRGAKQDEPQSASFGAGVDVEPWPEEVLDLGEVLQADHDEIKTYVAIEDYNVTLVVFFYMLTEGWEDAPYIPLLVLTSPEKGCGKSTLRDIIAACVRRPMKAVGVSDGSVHRLIGAFHPTLLIDEAQKLMGEHRENTSVFLNAGFQHGEVIRRWNMETNRFDEFDPACPKVISGIGTFLDDQALDRSIIIEMKRATKEEEEKLTDGAFFDPNAPHLVERRRKRRRWMLDNGREFRRLSREIMRQMPKAIRGRAENKFCFYFALAEMLGGPWPELIEKAAFLSLSHTALHADEPLEHRLLCDCHLVVTTRTDLLVVGVKGALFIATDNLLQALWGMPEAPWFAMPKGGKPLNASKLFFLLKRYKIASKPFSNGKFRGVYIDRILEEFARYKNQSADSTKGPQNKPTDDDDSGPPEPPQKPPPPPSSDGGTVKEEKFSDTPPENRCQVSNAGVNPLSPNDLSFDTSFDTCVLSGVKKIRGVKKADVECDPVSVSDTASAFDTSDTGFDTCVFSGVKCVNDSSVACYPLLLTPDTEKLGVYENIFSSFNLQPFAGMSSGWDRPDDTLSETAAYFQSLLESPSEWVGLDIETFAPPRFGKGKGKKRKPLKTNDAVNPWIGSIRLLTFADLATIHQCDLLKGPVAPELVERLSCAGWIIHNAGFDCLYLSLHFNLWPKSVFCTAVANRILSNGLEHYADAVPETPEPGTRKQSAKKKRELRNKLGPVLSDRLGISLPKDQGESDWSVPELSTAQRDYTLNDVRYLNLLASKQLATIRADGLETVTMLEMQLLPLTVRMQKQGWTVDRTKLELRRREYSQLTQEKGNYIRELLGEGCPKLGDNRKEKGLLDWIEKRTGVRLPNMQEETLTGWEHPIGKALVDFKKCEKRLGVFKSLLTHSAKDGKVHPHWNQTGAVTGRFSCSNPNVQQMENGNALFRDCFIAGGDDRCLVVGDFKHIEMRTGAIFPHAVTGLRTLLDLFLGEFDPHTVTAAAGLSKKLEEVSKSDRKLAKAVNFGFLYGQNAPGFLDYAKANYEIVLSLEQAQQFRESYFTRYPDLAGWHRWAWNEVDNVTETRTILGRRHLVPLTASKWNRFQALVNTPACGSAADLTKWSMVELDRVLPSDSYFVGSVHDELIIDTPIARAQEIKELMERVMAETFARLFDGIIPGPAEAGFGPNWEKAKP